MKVSGTPRSRRAEALLLAASVAFALLLVEGGLRVAGFTFPSLYTRDAIRGGALRPGAAALYTVEGRSFVRVNSRGQRDRERTLAKPPGTLRVAVLGDSYAEALQLPMEQAFWAVIERELGGCAALGGMTVEVLNFGVSGYGTAQELLTLRHVVPDYGPDVVLLAFLAGNDVGNNSRALEQDPNRPYFEYREGRLTLDRSFRAGLLPPGLLRLRDFAGDLTNRVRLLQFAHYLARRPWRAEAPAVGGGEAGLAQEIYREPRTPEWEEAWRVTEGLLGLLAQEAASQGARLLVATLPSPAQVAPDGAGREALERRLGVADLLYADRRVAAACARLGVPALVLAPPLLEHAERTGEVLHGFGASRGGGHWNAAGHRRAGELIAAELCRLLAGSPAGTRM